MDRFRLGAASNTSFKSGSTDAMNKISAPTFAPLMTRQGNSLMEKWNSYGVSITGSPRLSPGGNVPENKEEGEGSSDNGSWTKVCPQNLCFDELSSLSTVMSRDLNDDNMSSVEHMTRQKLERQNKRKFLARKSRFNIVFAEVKGSDKDAPNQVKLLREKMLGDWILVEENDNPTGAEYIYQVGEHSNYFQVSILEASLSDQLINHCEGRLNEYLNRKMNIQCGIDECVHVCVILFPCDKFFDNPSATLDQAFEEELQLMKRLNDIVSIIPVVTQIEKVDPVKIPIIRSWLRNLLSKQVKVFDDWFGQNSIPEETHGCEGVMSQESPLIPGPDFNLFDGVVVGNDGACCSTDAPMQAPKVTSEIISRLRSQVLTCPLVVDCTSDFATQDSRYKLPRFDSYPPTSCDFLRMILIEGCSLILMERTKTLFGSIAERRLRETARRKKIDQVHGLLVSGVIIVAATMSLFKRR